MPSNAPAAKSPDCSAQVTAPFLSAVVPIALGLVAAVKA